MHNDHIQLKGMLYIAAAGMCWGMIPIFSRIAYQAGGDPMTAAAVRAFIAAPVFLLWLIFSGALRKFSPRHIPFYLLYGTVAYAGTSFLYMLTVRNLNSSMAAVLQYTSPAFVILLGRIFYKEPITGKKLLALACTFGGCLLVVRAYDITMFKANLPGILLGFLSGFCFSMTTIVGKRAERLYPGSTSAGLMIVLGSAAFLFVKPPWQISGLQPTAVAAYIGLALVSTVMSYLLYFRGLHTGIDGGVASMTSTTEPVCAALLGRFLFQDSLEILQILGIVLVIGGICLPLLSGKKEEK